LQLRILPTELLPKLRQLFLHRFNFGQSAAGGNRFAKDLLAQAQLLR